MLQRSVVISKTSIPSAVLGRSHGPQKTSIPSAVLGRSHGPQCRHIGCWWHWRWGQLWFKTWGRAPKHWFLAACARVTSGKTVNPLLTWKKYHVMDHLYCSQLFLGGCRVWTEWYLYLLQLTCLKLNWAGNQASTLWQNASKLALQLSKNINAWRRCM